MCAMIYKQRPSSGALAGAAITMLLGCTIIWLQMSALRPGEELPASVLAIGSMTTVLFGVFLIVAFARYKFTHLWWHSLGHHRKEAHHHFHHHAHGVHR